MFVKRRNVFFKLNYVEKEIIFLLIGFWRTGDGGDGVVFLVFILIKIIKKFFYEGLWYFGFKMG